MMPTMMRNVADDDEGVPTMMKAAAGRGLLPRAR